MTATVRQAADADAEQISTLIEDVRKAPHAVALDEPQSPDDVRAWLRRQGEYGAMFVVEDGGDVVAFASVDFDSGRPRECSLGAWVRADQRRQGHATLLAEAALAFARERGYRRIRGRLPEENEPALSFLSSIGGMVPLTNPGASFELPLERSDA